MDVYGKAPVSETGKYFRNNVWWWRPLAEYCCSVAPEITAKCAYWQSNDGDGLGERASLKLADRLQAEIDSGRTAAFAAIREAEQHRLPDDPCQICAGTGLRLPPPACGAGDQPCNGCNGTGRVRPWETAYPFSVENVQEFIAFLRECGGFEIC